MLKKINRVLKLVGLNLVRAKRKKASPWQKVPLPTAPLSDYMGESEWQSTPPAAPLPHPEGGTHFVGDDCPGGHRDLIVAESTGNIAAGSDNVCFGRKTMARVVNPDAVFEPVDIGVDDHEISRVEQPNSDNKISGPTS